MTTYPRIDDKVILQEKFKNSQNYKDYFSSGQIDGMFGIVADVVGVGKYVHDDTIGYCDITKDNNIAFRVPLEFVEYAEGVKEQEK